MTIQDWFEKRKEAQIQRRALEAKAETSGDPELWTKCVHCDAQILKDDLINNDKKGTFSWLTEKNADALEDTLNTIILST